MKAQTLTSLARRIASTVGRREGIRVNFKGKTANTTGKVINLPAIIPGTVLTEHEVSMFLGYLDHEISHILNTDFVVWDAIKSNMLRSIVNILEDVRIENLYIDKYPGSVYNLDVVCDHMEKEFLVDLSKNGEDIGNLSLSKVVTMLYEHAYSFRGRPYHRSEKLSSFKSLEKLEPLVEGAVKSSNTKIVAEKSAEILTILEKMFPREKEQGKSEGSPKAPSGEGGKGLPSPSGTGQASTANAVGDHSDDGDMDWRDSDLTNDLIDDLITQGSASHQGEKKDNKQKPNGLVDLEVTIDWKKAEEILGHLGEKNSKAGALLEEKNELEQKEDKKNKKGTHDFTRGTIVPPVTLEYDQIFVPSKENLDSYKSTLQNLSSEASMLKKSLHIFLQSRAKRSNERNLEEGTFDGNSAWKIKAGEYSRVFKQKREVDQVNTAVCMMLDLSGSMNQSILKQTSVLVAEALLGVSKIKLQMAGFTTTTRSGHSSSREPGGRSVPLSIPLFKGYDEEGRKTRARIGAIQKSQATPLGEAFAFGYESLLDRKEKKRVLWIVTDGEPSFPSNDHNHNDYLLMSRVKRNCVKQGIEVIGIEIGSNNILNNFTDLSVSISDSGKLPGAVLEMIKGLVDLRVK